MYRQAQWMTSVVVGGRDLGRFKQFEGGAIDSEDSKYQNWDGDIPLGGRRTRDNGTARRLYREEDHLLAPWLDANVGASSEITRVPMGDDGVPWGAPLVLKGKLKRVAVPDHDTGSDDGGELELEFTLGSDMA